ncbi:Phospholipid hydroperoxide glutathione peroxidase [Sarcoptes scabiei]|uniref:Phospholipid hydroperoxide glutathione peroxidase, mitochondrial n=1 Tax=Sarcoptes scabiei TaxID=52283 RepID=A0A834RCY9_SARSC|nr:Phospholipid hydroperoxide glutathione peroxidase [Sarcoptes scabiei]
MVKNEKKSSKSQKKASQKDHHRDHLEKSPIPQKSSTNQELDDYLKNPKEKKKNDRKELVIKKSTLCKIDEENETKHHEDDQSNQTKHINDERIVKEKSKLDDHRSNAKIETNKSQLQQQTRHQTQSKKSNKNAVLIKEKKDSSPSKPSSTVLSQIQQQNNTTTKPQISKWMDRLKSKKKKSKSKIKSKIRASKEIEGSKEKEILQPSNQDSANIKLQQPKNPNLMLLSEHSAVPTSPIFPCISPNVGLVTTHQKTGGFDNNPQNLNLQNVSNPMLPVGSVPYFEPLGKTVYQFQVKTLDGQIVSMEQYRGYTLIILNFASKDLMLGPKNISQLNQLYFDYQQHGLKIAAFPSNDFCCEPLEDNEMEAFIREKQIKFDVFAKISVNGENSHPMFSWLRQCLKQQKRIQDPASDIIKFNFTKFLIDRHGVLFRHYSPLTAPINMEPDIKALLC